MKRSVTVRAVGGAAAALAAAVTAAVILTVANRSDGQEEKRAEVIAYQKRVENAFKPVSDDLEQLLQGHREWTEGRMATVQISESLARLIPSFEKVVTSLSSPSRADDIVRARGLFKSSAGTYLDFLRLEQAALSRAADDPLRAQLDLAARRARILGDRLYDRGRAVLDPQWFANATPGVDLRLPAEVPDFLAEGLAPGPPLAEARPPEGEPGQLRNSFRPTQPEKEWREEVSDTEVPSASRVTAAIRRGDARALARMGDRLSRVVRTFDALPDPKDQRERAAVLYLGLLVRSEAARAGQAAVLVGDPVQAEALRAVARHLLEVSQGLSS